MGIERYGDIADQFATEYGIPTDLFRAVIDIESSWRPRVVSPKGAVGLTQLMPRTARALGVDPWNPTENLKGGAKFLNQLFTQYGNWRDALAHYNAGYNLEAGYGYADKVLSRLSDSNQSLTPVLDEIAAGGTDFGNKIPERVNTDVYDDTVSALTEEKVAGESKIKSFFRKFGLWILAGLLIILGFWRLIK